MFPFVSPGIVAHGSNLSHGHKYKAPFSTFIDSLSPHKPTGPSTYRYYSAQVVEVSNGAVVRALPTALGRIIADHASTHLPKRTGQANIWLSSPGSCTPLHYDATSNIFTQVVGGKVVVVCPPEALPFARLLPWASSLQRSARAGWDGTIPADLASEPVEIGGVECTTQTLGPGDSLFIPPYFLHHVCTLLEGPSVSLSLWAETPEQLAGRALVSGTPPFEPSWGRRERVMACLSLLPLLCGGELLPAVAKELHSRYGATKNEQPPQCKYRATSLDLARLFPSPLWNSSSEGGGDSGGGISGQLLSTLPAFAAWHTPLASALAAQHSDIIRTVLLANWLETALIKALNLTRGRQEGGGRLSTIILGCAGFP